MSNQLPPNQQLDPWDDGGFEIGYERPTEPTPKENEGNSENGEESKKNREVIQNSEEVEKQTEIIKELRERQEKTQNSIRINLEKFAIKFHLSGSLLDKGDSFNGVTTQSREQIFEQFEDEEREILEKKPLTKEDEKKLKKINQKRMGLILEQTFADTFNINRFLVKVARRIRSLSESEKQNFSQINFSELNGEMVNFLTDFNQVKESPEFYRGDDREDVSFKRVLCEEYDKSMNLNKDVDRRTNYDQFLELEIQKISEKINFLAEKVKVKKDGNSAEKLSKNVKNSFEGKSGNEEDDKESSRDSGKEKNTEVVVKNDDFDHFMETGSFGDDVEESEGKIDSIGKEIDEEGKNFF